MEATLSRLLPDLIPADFDEFMAMTVPALIECSRCIIPQRGVADIIVRTCVVSIGSGADTCDHCRHVHLPCDASLIGRDRILWMLARLFREQGQPVAEATPDHEIDELWSPPPVVEDDDPDYVPSEVDELEEKEEEGEVPAALWGELFGEELPSQAQHILAEDILAVIRAEVARAPEPGSSPAYPIVLE